MSHAISCPLPVVCTVAGSAAKGLAGAIAAALVSAFAGWCASAASWLLGLVGATLAHTTAPPVTTAWFAARQRVVLAASAPVALLALVAAALHATVRGAPGELVRTALLRVPTALLLGAAGAGLVGVAVGATDELSANLAAGAPTSLTASLHGLAVGVAATAGLPGAAAGLVAAMVALGAFVLWVELVVRAAAITIGTALLPLVCAAALWPPATPWARRLAETLGALIVAKAVIVLVLVLALDAVAHAGAGAATALTGGAMLLLASLAPFVVLRLVPLIEGAAVSHLESVRHRATGAARQVGGRAVSLAVAGAGAAAVPSVDAVGSNPIGLLEGLDVDVTAGTCLDPTAARPKGRPPTIAVPASKGRHVWERDRWGPRLVWKAPWEPEA
jgi:hypothetical protein